MKPTPFGTQIPYEEKEFKVVGTNPEARPDAVDKVTGKARYAADINLPGQLIGKVLRSPHAHANIKSIDTSAAEALKGVKAVVTRDNFADLPVQHASAGEIMVNFRDVTRAMMAREKALFDGHPVAAVAATSESIAKAALKLIKVDYEVLPHVIEVADAMKPDAPLLNEEQFTKGVEPAPDKPSNIAAQMTSVLGDIEEGFGQAELIVEHEFNTKAAHQGYIEPHSSLANYTEGGNAEIWTSTQGHFLIRAQVAKVLAMEVSRVKVTPAELGGGFGGKNMIYLEPLAVQLSKKSGRPVKMTMTRDEVFRASGPTSGTNIIIKIGVTKKGRITAAKAILNYQSGCFPGSSLPLCTPTAFTRYDIPNVLVIGNDVVCNRPKVAAYRAPGAPMIAFGVETIMDEIAEELKIDPIEIRLLNAAKEGTQTHFGPKLGPIGYIETLEAAQAHDHMKTKLGPNQGRGIATGFWNTLGMETSATLNINQDGTASFIYGTVDVAGGMRAAYSQMVAEELGIPFENVKSIQSDTTSLGFNFTTAGSRGTAAGGMAAVKASRDAITRMCEVAARIWEVEPDEVVWEDGHARPAGSNVGDFDPLSLAEIAAKAGFFGGTIAGHAEINVTGGGPGFGTHLVDVEVDRDTGAVKVLRYTIIQDAGKAIFPDYVKAQFHGAAVQGIGLALNEEYIYDDKGVMINPGFLDYRIPVASDIPPIETQIVEVPNPLHPYGVRGVGEVPIIPPLGAIANAIYHATGVRMRSHPMSPPKVLAALEEAAPAVAAE
ncbi:MAG: xanthine dehydrogenase family protein molybdopterin-binding subunit [Rhodospirillaceae bacterium]|nr:xanthine dehydrogenase family protein molybdopterin-binding subunit [Rhodospirillaceae bacterium]MBT4939150.1 xanthine dehydrogenase family protein molybdopterin-binding subunit [Rhodospirillaceae bacterium]MBT7268378.1 xanthine dehydrogenase family protein molybdopterin-binding subunit [Rhodospirillaceae bacterium]